MRLLTRNTGAPSIHGGYVEETAVVELNASDLRSIGCATERHRQEARDPAAALAALLDVKRKHRIRIIDEDRPARVIADALKRLLRYLGATEDEVEQCVVEGTME